MKTVEKCESFFSSKLASFLCEPRSLKGEEDELRALARATAMESQSIYVEKSFGDFTNDGINMTGWAASAAAPTRMTSTTSSTSMSAGVPAGVYSNGRPLAGTFSAPIGCTGSLQAPVTGALHGSLRLPLSGSFVGSPSPLLKYRESLDEMQKEEMRKQFSESVKQAITAQANPAAPESHSAEKGSEPSMQRSIKMLKMHLGLQPSVVHADGTSNGAPGHGNMVVPVVQMQQGFGPAAAVRQITGGSGASHRERSPLALSGRALNLSSKMPTMTARGQVGHPQKPVSL